MSATFIMFISTMDSLNLTRQKYYRDFNFSDVFVDLKRAPESLKSQIAGIPGVNIVETRVSAEVKLDIPRFSRSRSSESWCPYPTTANPS